MENNICPEVLSFEKCETAAVASPLVNLVKHVLVNDLCVSEVPTFDGCKIWCLFVHRFLSQHRSDVFFFSPLWAPDVPPVVRPVFLELPGLDGNLPLPLRLRADGC